MKVKMFSILVVMMVMGGAVSAFAHHGFGVEFDANNCLDLKGTLTGITWENPHAYFDMSAKDPQGNMQSWHLEMVTPNALKRTGSTKADFEANIGKPISARACLAKGGKEHRGAASYLALADGQIRLVGQQVERRADEDKHF
jgi:Family of unknown function (DUF6152)